MTVNRFARAAFDSVPQSEYQALIGVVARKSMEIVKLTEEIYRLIEASELAVTTMEAMNNVPAPDDTDANFRALYNLLDCADNLKSTLALVRRRL